KKSADELASRLDNLNKRLVDKFSSTFPIRDNGLSLEAKPLTRIGIYIPKKMPSSAYTFLSAAVAAGVSEIIIYLAQDNNGDADPLTLYLAQRYKTRILTGPARIAFPTLAFGTEHVSKCDMICGPCGANMNILKTLCGEVGKVAVDMAAGPSDLSIIVDNTNKWERIYLDLLSQIEHGPDSKSTLIVVGQEIGQSLESSRYFKLINQVPNINLYIVDTPQIAINKVREIAPETLEIYSRSPDQYLNAIKYCGVVYKNLSSTLGDYGVIGRGCADPTGGHSIGQSGISPLMFFKLVSVVDSTSRISLLKSALNLAKYEGLVAHQNVLEFELAHLDR
ncbi:MAG: histidinol dehydrogenase, partial [Bacteroidetes bacterium]|nr:histidinol dehydrogenase [Bacteroidota bacterium]